MDQLLARKAFIERALKSRQFTPEEMDDIRWEYDRVKQEIKNRNDRKYVLESAKIRAEQYLDDIKP